MQKYSSSHLLETARANFRNNPKAKALDVEHKTPGDRDAVRSRVGKARAIADNDPVFRLERFCQRFVALEIFANALPAIEERREQFEEFLKDTNASPACNLELSSDITVPKYHDIEWHLEPDGWDGYDLYGALFAFALGPLVFRHGGYAAVNVGDDLYQNRRDSLAFLPKKKYGRIYEPGCGGGTTVAVIHELFPEAEIVGSDLSPLLLRMAHLTSSRLGTPVTYKQRDSTHTGEEAESFDAAVTYALQHEMPPKENIKLFKEMFRILRPGGDFLIVDPPPFAEVELFQAVILDWDTHNRREPFFSATLLADWKEDLKKIGFENISSAAAGKNGFPWVIRATKPRQIASLAA